MLLGLAYGIGVVSIAYSLLTNGLSILSGTTGVVNVLCGLIFHIATAFCGAMTGAFFHNRIINDRRVLLCGAFITAIVAIAKDLIVKQIAIFKYIKWIFPPVCENIGLFKNTQNYNAENVIKSISMMLIYGIIVCVIKDIVLSKKKF